MKRITVLFGSFFTGGFFLETVTGYVDHVIFHNKENGYAVVSLECEGEELICVGNFRSIATSSR